MEKLLTQGFEERRRIKRYGFKNLTGFTQSLDNSCFTGALEIYYRFLSEFTKKGALNMKREGMRFELSGSAFHFSFMQSLGFPRRTDS